MVVKVRMVVTFKEGGRDCAGAHGRYSAGGQVTSQLFIQRHVAWVCSL